MCGHQARFGYASGLRNVPLFLSFEMRSLSWCSEIKLVCYGNIMNLFLWVTCSSFFFFLNYCHDRSDIPTQPRRNRRTD